MSLNRIKKEIRKEVIEPATDSRKLFRLNRFISSRYTVIIFLILLDILLFGAINYIVNVLSHAFDWFVTQEKISYGIINIFPNLANFVPETDQKEVLELMESKSDQTFFTGYAPDPYTLTDLKRYEEILPLKQNDKSANSKVKKQKPFHFFRR
jgi:hypothetical protein